MRFLFAFVLSIVFASFTFADQSPAERAAVAIASAGYSNDVSGRAAAALSFANASATLPDKPVDPPVDLSMYDWKQIDEEEAALLCHGKQCGTLIFDTGKFYIYDGKNWSKTPSEPPITRMLKLKRPVGICNGGCGQSCPCPANRGASASSCPCDASHKHYPPLTATVPSVSYLSQASNCST